MKKYFGLLLNGMGALCLISTPSFAMGKKPPAPASEIVTSFSCYDIGSGNGAFIMNENTIDLKEGTITRAGDNLVRKITSTSIQQLSDGSG